MALIVQDLGELVYGGAVTGFRRYDQKRVDEGKIGKKDILKKVGFYTYLVPGLICTGATAFGWLRKWNPWTERMTHGFIYDIPNFTMSLVDAFKEEGAGSLISEAERIAREAAARRSPRKPVGQTTKPGFEDVQIW